MKPKPYVGITGIKLPDEIKELTEFYIDNGYLSASVNYQPMLGFVTSAKRLKDKSLSGTSSPAAIDLDFLTKCTPRGSLSMMHYFTENKNKLANEVIELFTFSNMYTHNYCRALQINNTSWPVVKQLERIKATFPEMQIVLQLPRQILLAESTVQIARQANEYSHLVEYCLLDPSGGEGKDFSVGFSADLMAALDEVMPNTMMGVAGGLTPENVNDKITAVAERYKKPFCIDAQGKLRTEDGEFIDPKKARKYVAQAASELAKNQLF